MPAPLHHHTSSKHDHSWKAMYTSAELARMGPRLEAAAASGAWSRNSSSSSAGEGAVNSNWNSACPPAELLENPFGDSEGRQAGLGSPPPQSPNDVHDDEEEEEEFGDFVCAAPPLAPDNPSTQPIFPEDNDDDDDDDDVADTAPLLPPSAPTPSSASKWSFTNGLRAAGYRAVEFARVQSGWSSV
ncbi:hypothetical protein BDV95DRAFT_16276 [Massariosphaeria phaeospora]|uniref:Uncharacterized protein n=1 Tax=Massariosphaeria phaeospora TaxID=100035 RepID=A0A7C8IFD0_9PLEO|nr:hypothetical protein BDV95DRAFT_16276 [Massariosphaeria phaeospora]